LGILGISILVAAALTLVFVRPQIVIPDSKNFKDALNLWDKVITDIHRTPRELKRFMNNLRWVAARTRESRPPPRFADRVRASWQDMFGTGMPQAPGKFPEPVLVGLAVLQAAGFRGEPPDIHLFLLSSSGSLNGDATEAYEKHRMIAGDDTFGNWPPTPEQIRLFFELVGDGSAATISTGGSGERAPML